METAVQLNVALANVPGALARLCDKLRSADVNIDAMSCTAATNETVVHMIVDDPETAKIVLKEIAEVTTVDVLAFRLRNKPGAIAQISRTCAGAGINIRNIYATTNGKEAMVYVAVDDMAKARKAF